MGSPDGSAPFSTAQLDGLLAFASANTAARPEAVYVRPGDVVWRLTLGHSGEPGDIPWLRLWFDGDGIAGYVWLEGTTQVELDLRAELAWDGKVGAAMLDWAEEQRCRGEPAWPWIVDVEDMAQWAEGVRVPPAAGDERWLAIGACESDEDRVGALLDRGFEPTGHHAIVYARDLAAPLPESGPPALRVRHVTEADIDERVAVHRDAWLGSSWTAERYRALRATPPYAGECDLVVEGDGGRFAACCICWPDPVSGAGHFEPVGSRPEYRGKGLTRALVREGFRRLAERGMATAHTETPGFNHPAQALYEASGFTRAGKRRTFVKRVDGLARRR